MPFIDPSKIIIPPDRYRKDLSSVEKRAEEIQRVGQFAPSLVREKYEGEYPDDPRTLVLIDGECRTRACQLLGRKVWYTTSAEGQVEVSDEYQHRLLELMANISRQDMTPLEKAKAIADLDRLLKEKHGQSGQSHTREPGQEGWSAEKTAALMGYKNKDTVRMAITIARAAETMPELAEAKTASEAMKMIQTKIRLEAQEELASRRIASPQSGPIENPAEYFSKRVILGELPNVMESLPSGIVSIFLTDIPYAIDYKPESDAEGKSENKDVGKKIMGLYKDTPEEVLPVVEGTIIHIARTGRPNCFVYMFCAFRYWSYLSSKFQEIGFDVYNKPITWVPGNMAANKIYPGICRYPARWPSSTTDCILFAVRGDAALARQGQPDVIICDPHPSSQKIHSLQRPVPLLIELISRVFHPETRGLLVDPFLGSGTSLAAALHFPGLDFFGYEKNPEFRKRAVAYLINYYTELHNPKPESILDDDLELEME